MMIHTLCKLLLLINVQLIILTIWLKFLIYRMELSNRAKYEADMVLCFDTAPKPQDEGEYSMRVAQYAYDDACQRHKDGLISTAELERESEQITKSLDIFLDEINYFEDFESM